MLFKLYDDLEWTYLEYANIRTFNALLPNGEEDLDLFNDDEDKYTKLHVNGADVRY